MIDAGSKDTAFLASTNTQWSTSYQPRVMTNSCNRRVCRGQIRLNRSLCNGEQWATEADRSFDVTLSYAKFYVKYHLSSLRSTKKEQGTVSSSRHQPLGPVSISRRCAAGGCANAQGPLTRTRGQSRSVWGGRGSAPSTDRRRRLWALPGGHGARGSYLKGKISFFKAC